jgi:hypothetical protein
MFCWLVAVVAVKVVLVAVVVAVVYGMAQVILLAPKIILLLLELVVKEEARQEVHLPLVAILLLMEKLLMAVEAHQAIEVAALVKAQENLGPLVVALKQIKAALDMVMLAALCTRLALMIIPVAAAVLEQLAVMVQHQRLEMEALDKPLP